MNKAIIEGTSKSVYQVDENRIILVFRDDATAFDNTKKAIIEGKGICNCKISTKLYKKLEDANIPTHLISQYDDRSQLCYQAEMIPLEVIIRNIASGSITRRLGIEEGKEFPLPIYELYYKNPGLNNPLINDHHATVLGIASLEDLQTIYRYAMRINEIILPEFKKVGFRLVDMKLEFGRTVSGKIVLADEISPDTCRLWDTKTGEKMDKDRFRFDMGSVIEAYTTVLQRLEE